MKLSDLDTSGIESEGKYDDASDPNKRRPAHLARSTAAAKSIPTSDQWNRDIDVNATDTDEVGSFQSLEDEDLDVSHVRKKRRITMESERLRWSDDNPTNDGELAFKKFKSQKSEARKKALKSTRIAKAIEAKKYPQDHQRKHGKQSKESTTGKTIQYGDRSSDGDLMEDTLPDYVQERRGRFDERTKLLKEGGLALPPSYETVEFSDDERLEHLKERPEFPNGLQPCAPYEDIQLPYSLGLIPAAIAQWLREYQVKGAEFLHQLFVYQKGGILGDDMGLGKTVQVIAFLTAAYGKTGDERDRKRMRKLRRAGNQWYPRTLIICPGSLMENWREELDRWGWWHSDIYHGTSTHKEAVLSAAQSGHLEIMITTYDTYRLNKSAINMISWDCVVADEFHKIKERKADIARTMNEVNALCRIGLTGTAIQNKYEELWTLLNWTNPGRFGPISTWKASICEPLKLGQSHDASVYQLARARKTAKMLVENLLPQFFIRRMKTLIKDQLPKKSDLVVFCPLTDTQAGAYENYLDGEIVQAIKHSSEPCECGSGKKGGWCCHTLLEDGSRWQSWVFPAIATLQKLSNHLAILIPNTNDPPEKQAKDLDTLAIALPGNWENLYKNRDSIANFMNPEFCGKWKILKKLLKFWHDDVDANNKVLVFSHSVRLLKMLQKLFVNTSYNVSYLDGAMKYDARYATVAEFNTDPSQFVFLISTKAGGVGLNITSANKVVIVDPNWNPSYDLQAQDRAYRIGQTRDVEVFRLVSQGTLEEIVYARQIYKQQQASIGYNASSERRYFQGVQGHVDQKGEIFGLQNLFAYQNEHLVLKDIFNKTNVAESRADVRIATLELDDEQDAEDDDGQIPIKVDDKEDAAMSQLVAEITGDDDETGKQYKNAKITTGMKKKHDPVTAILASVGVQYTHENSEVIGSSEVETRLSKQAEEAAEGERWAMQEQQAKVFFDDRQNQAGVKEIAGADVNGGIRYKYRPPSEVKRRQFCTMAKWAGYEDVVDFALVVEGWTQAERRDWLGGFYRWRRHLLAGKTTVKVQYVQDKELGWDASTFARKETKHESLKVNLKSDMEDDDDEL